MGRNKIHFFFFVSHTWDELPSQDGQQMEEQREVYHVQVEHYEGHFK